MKKIIILFGGVSPEHEVSVISGLQVIENIDRKQFIPYPIKLSKEGLFEYYPNLHHKQEYLKRKPKIVNFGRDKKGPFFVKPGFLNKKIYIDAAYVAFHGGNGEAGQMQGFMEILDIPYTSANVEASSIAMNKILTKEVLERNKISTIEYTRVFSVSFSADVDGYVKKILSTLKLPLIVKPAHLGSSIGINVAYTEVELKKFLLEASQIDSEILIEKFVQNFIEYNVSVRNVNGIVEASEVEKPISRDEILSFADKYQRGGKKSGGMASLSRELPAKISNTLTIRLQRIATSVFEAIRAKGVIRVDFMVIGKKVYVTEINPIPGSMSYYLWEASGISFKEQISDLILQAIYDNQVQQSQRFEYQSDIIEKFVSNTNR